MNQDEIKCLHVSDEPVFSKNLVPRRLFLFCFYIRRIIVYNKIIFIILCLLYQLELNFNKARTGPRSAARFCKILKLCNNFIVKNYCLE